MGTVRQKGAKARKEFFSQDPLNVTGQHNASSQGFTQDNAVGLQFTEAPSKSGKKYRKQFDLLQTHKPKSGAYKKTNANATFGCQVNSTPIRRGVHYAAKVINGLSYTTDKKKALLLRRLGKLN